MVRVIITLPSDQNALKRGREFFNALAKFSVRTYGQIPQPVGMWTESITRRPPVYWC